MLTCTEISNPKSEIQNLHQITSSHMLSPDQRSRIQNPKFASDHILTHVLSWPEIQNHKSKTWISSLILHTCALIVQYSARVLTDLESKIGNSPLYISGCNRLELRRFPLNKPLILWWQSSHYLCTLSIPWFESHVPLSNYLESHTHREWQGCSPTQFPRDAVNEGRSIFCA